MDGLMRDQFCVGPAMFWENFPFANDYYSGALMRLTDETLTYSKIEAVIIPGGCTKYVQAPDVVWSRPFKDRIEERYDDWFANVKHENALQET